MATISQRGVLRSLPALVALFFALFVSPQVAVPPAGPDVAPAAVAPGATYSSLVQAADPPAAEAPAVATSALAAPAAAPAVAAPAVIAASAFAGVLRSQRDAGPAGSRAPPSAIA